MRNFFALALTLATSFSTVSAAPKALKANKTDDAFMLSCISERTGPDGGISVTEAYRVCRAEVRHQAKIERAVARAAKAIESCEQAIVDLCVESAAEDGSSDCTDSALTRRGAFQVCHGK